MIKILFLNHTGSVFGSETILLQVLDSLYGEKEFELHVIYLKTNHQEFENAIKSIGITHYRNVYYKMMDCDFFKSIIKLGLSIIAFFKILYYVRKKGIEVIYSNTSINIYGITIAKLAKKKHVWHYHEEPCENFTWVNHAFFSWYRWLLKYDKNTVIFISNKQKEKWEQMLNVSFANYKIVYSPLKKIEDRSIDTEGYDVSFGYLGGFTQIPKNIMMLLNCFFRLSSSHPTYKMRLILKGKGPMEEKIKEFISSHDLTEKVFIQRYSSELSSFFSSINVFVLPSFFESWGLVAIEAMSLGKYTIITKNAPISELIPEEYYTYIDPYDEDSLYNAMKKALANPAIPQSQTDQLNEIMRKNNESFCLNIRNIVFNL